MPWGSGQGGSRGWVTGSAPRRVTHAAPLARPCAGRGLALKQNPPPSRGLPARLAPAVLGQGGCRLSSGILKLALAPEHRQDSSSQYLGNFLTCVRQAPNDTGLSYFPLSSSCSRKREPVLLQVGKVWGLSRTAGICSWHGGAGSAGSRARQSRCSGPSATLIYTWLAGSTQQAVRDLPKAGLGPASLVPRGRRCSRELPDLWERLVIYCAMETNVFGAHEMV